MGFTGAAGISVNDIPYRAHGQLLADLASGQLDGAVAAVAAFDPALAPPLAIFADNPSPLYPGLPTVVSEGYPISLQAFGGIYARAGLAPGRQRALEAAGRRAFDSPAFQEQVRRLGCEPVFGDSAAFTARLKAESEAMRALLARLGLLAD
jgi:tripartite-type tricarboxylate transporter receptor subunit TctC